MGRFCGFLRKICTGAFVVCAVAFTTGAAHAACTADQIDVLGDGTQCETAKFSVTTSGTKTLSFTMTAVGTFYVDCSGGTLAQAKVVSGDTIDGKTVTRGNTTSVTYTCTWSKSSTYTVKFGGVATEYTSDSGAAIAFNKTGSYVESISGSLG